ncbi:MULTISPECIES: Bug family tripartite tricarboxylate transporter substrate binding protein [unclassified Variovorax]|uniref:Bug family tripartite tricarboxylate transporter substrate binding protein n=1 Tax=unclassified Variovorax TaxID=663243 RepID=UPI000D134456|nr:MULTISPECIES: tripartite tricarboxylate transporter substrate binding protein [unclassified Variovorax]AVQ83784.1 LacI family transcriptional regulator [Variovorax sp. PMC12]QRY31825.1 tripartite tricarboxylate transporter substrate binding protein [Variovorax sp. PDNC026]
MKKTTRVLKTIAAIAACAPLLGWAAWPDKPIRMVVPYAAGGGADNTARIVAQQMSAALGQQIVIDNRPGAGGVIGEDNVAKAAGDGYTVLYDASAFSVNPALRKLPFDAAKDFIPVSLVATAPQILVVPENAPYKTVAEFLDFARKNPGKLSFASAGGGTGSHLAGEALNEQAKVNLMHVPYKGGAPALTDLMGGQVSAYFGNVASTLGYVKSGKLRALAVSSTRRVPALPDTPTLGESGLPGYNVVEWNGVFLPKGTPPDIVQKLGKAVQAAVNDPTVRQKLLQLGLEPAGTTPEAFARFVQDETGRVSALVRARNIRVD